MRVSNGGSYPLIAVAVLLAVAQGAAAAAAEDEEEELSEVAITGTRIAASVGMATATPVTAVSVEELTAMSPSTLISALSQLPQFYGNNTSDVRTGFFSSPGSGNLN